MKSMKTKICFLTVAATVAVTTVLTPQPARADFWDFIFGPEEQSPPPKPAKKPVKKPAKQPVKMPEAQGYPDDYDPRYDDPYYDQYEREGEGYDETEPAPQPQLGKELTAVEEFRRQPKADMAMYITRPTWTDKDEEDFGKFVAQLGRAIQAKKCNTVKKCMKSEEANMFASDDPPGVILYSDCADFPYFLRAYFAYHRGLPMEFVDDITLNKAPYSSEANREGDLVNARLDNSPYGNRVESRGGSTLVKGPGYERNFLEYLEAILDTVSTRTLRVGPLSPKYDLSDFYPVKLDRDGIRQGTVVHSTGHAYVVFDVDKKGTVHMIDAHPDGSVSKKEIKAATLDRSRPDHGLGFFRFRPLTVTGAKKSADGALYGGKISATTDAELFKAGKWSVEQWFGPGSSIAPGTQVDPTAWKDGFKKQNFFDYLAGSLRQSGTTVSPDEEVADQMQSLCTEFQQRVEDVDVALTKKHNLNLKPHPATLPQNIYSATQPWEDTSTPSRDGRMKAAVEDIIKVAVSKYREAKKGVKGVKFEGSSEDYVKALRKRLTDIDKSCKIAYTNSVGKKVSLSFQQVISRLNRLSFDPYHCAEKRWGASGKELESCKDTDKGHAWYKAQLPMRNTVGKLTAAERLIIRSDRPITLEMLADASLIDQPEESPVNLGTVRAPIMDLDKNFSSPKFLELLK